MRWQELPGATAAEGPHLVDLKQVLDRGGEPAPDWREVRARLERKVWRVPAGPGALFVKLQLYRSFRVRFRYAIRPSPVAKEAGKSRRLLAANSPPSSRGVLRRTSAPSARSLIRRPSR